MKENLSKLYNLEFKAKIIEEIKFKKNLVKSFIEDIDSEDKFIFFLIKVRNLIKLDSQFLILDNKIIDKIKEVINFERFEYKSKDIMDECNSIIIYLNNLSSVPDELIELDRQQYLDKESKLRDTKITDILYLETAIYFDYLFYNYIQVCQDVTSNKYKNNINNIKNNFKQLPDIFISSANYFLTEFPEMISKKETNQVIDDSIEINLASERLGKREEIMTKKSLFQKVKDTIIPESQNSRTSRLLRLQNKISEINIKHY